MKKILIGLFISFLLGLFISLNYKFSIIISILFLVFIFLINLWFENKLYFIMIFIQKFFLSWLLFFSIFQLSNFESYKIFYIYLIIMIIYHNSEFYFILLYRYEQLICDSFLLFHSYHYYFVTLWVYIEFLYNYNYNILIFEKYFIISIFGLIFMIIGLLIRSSSYFYAKRNFSHKIKYYKEMDHKLITTGIYKYERHPSYLGFFIFSISSQILLLNKINFILFMIILSMFFKRRIRIEEKYLKQIFYKEYFNYMKNTKSFINFYKK